MACLECEDNPLKGAFYRWSNANIEIIACEKHWIEVRDALNKSKRNQPGWDYSTKEE